MAGFSRASPENLVLPPIMNPVYGYEAINVEAQAGDQYSLLNWTRRMLTVRKRHKAFGRGTLRFLYPGNRKVLAYLREYEDETILCVCNVSRVIQAVELDLSGFAGRIPVDLTGGSTFPPIGQLPYLLTLPPFAFYWFILSTDASLPDWHLPAPEPMAELSDVGPAAAGSKRCWRRRNERVLEQRRCRLIWRAVAGSRRRTRRSTRSACRWRQTVSSAALDLILTELEVTLSRRTEHLSAAAGDRLGRRYCATPCRSSLPWRGCGAAGGSVS